jgi:hypothetical protein
MLVLMRTMGFDMIGVPKDALLHRVAKSIDAKSVAQKDLMHAK